jgi:DNA invertase Pin-like site-specific DNA recombinase
MQQQRPYLQTLLEELIHARNLALACEQWERVARYEDHICRVEQLFPRLEALDNTLRRLCYA